MPEDIQPPAGTGSNSKGGIIEEWKHASTKEKVFIVGGIAAVLLIMLYIHNKSSSNPITSNAGTVVPAGSGLTPMNGVGGGVTTSGGGSGTTTVGSTAGGSTNSNPQPKYNGPSFTNLPWGTKFTVGNTIYQLGTGSGGRLWGVPVSSNQTLNEAQFNAVPISAGQKTLLVAPNGSGSMFHP